MIIISDNIHHIHYIIFDNMARKIVRLHIISATGIEALGGTSRCLRILNCICVRHCLIFRMGAYNDLHPI